MCGIVLVLKKFGSFDLLYVFYKFDASINFVSSTPRFYLTDTVCSSSSWLCYPQSIEYYIPIFRWWTLTLETTSISSTSSITVFPQFFVLGLLGYETSRSWPISGPHEMHSFFFNRSLVYTPLADDFKSFNQGEHIL